MDINVLCEKSETAAALKRSAAAGGINEIYECVMPYVMRDDFSDAAARFLSAPDVVVRSWDELGWLKQNGYQGKIIADAGLYTFNREAVSALKEAGAAYDTVPLELNIHEMLERGIANSELVVYGRVPMMITSQCLYRNTHNDRCEKDILAGHEAVLTDRTGTDFISMCFCRYCCNVLFNSVPISLHTETDTIIKAAPRSVRLYFTDETPEEAARITDYFVRMFDGRDAGTLPIKGYTKGHFRKGVE